MQVGQKEHSVERNSIYSYAACDRRSNQPHSLITKLQSRNMNR